jgi:hypothetical protein
LIKSKNFELTHAHKKIIKKKQFKFSYCIINFKKIYFRMMCVKVVSVLTLCWLKFSFCWQSVGCMQLLFILNHRYLMSRFSLQVFYLWRHVLSTAPPFILWWSNLEILVAPLHRSSPFIGGLRCQAIQTDHGPYIAERTKKQSILWDVYVLNIQMYSLFPLNLCFNP